jgi:hypothetical protein
VNRSAELQEMAKIFLHNLSIVPSNMNDQKFKLVLTCQMFGSGKTSLGEQFLYKIPEYRESLQNYKDTTWQKLLRLEYVLVDLRFAGFDLSLGQDLLTFSSLFMQHLARCIIHHFKLNDEQCQSLFNTPVADTTTLILRLLKIASKSETLILFHFDELDLWRPYPDDTPRGFYYLWNQHLMPILRSGHQVYCSGRSPVLFELGKGYYKNRTLNSPEMGASECIILDVLHTKHIEKLVDALTDSTHQYPRLSFQLASKDNVKKDVAQILFRVTAGVPRLLMFAFEYLAEQKQQPLTKAQVSNLLKRSFTIWAYNKGPREVAPYEDLTEGWQKLYMEFLLVSALQIQVPLEEKIQETGITPEPTSCIGLIREMSLYAGRDEPKQGKQCLKVIYPGVVLDHLISRVQDRTTLMLFLNSARHHLQLNAADGVPLETALRYCLKYRWILYVFFFF